MKNKKKKIVIWGCKNRGKEIYKKLQTFGKYEICAFADNDVQMIGSKIYGIDILGENDLLQMTDIDFIIIASSYSAEIKKQLSGKFEIPVCESLDELVKRCAIDITGWCNAKCKYCATGMNQENKNKEHMSINLFKSVYKHLLSLGIGLSEILLYNWGEPLLNPDYLDIIEYLDKQDQIFSISTNASIVRTASYPDAYRKCKTATFSLSGFSQKSYGYIHGFTLSVILSNIEKILNNMRETGFDGEAELSFHVYRFNENEINQAKEFANKNSMKFSPVYAYLNSYKLSKEYLTKELNSEIHKMIDEELYLDYLPELMKKKTEFLCPLTNMISIDHKGNLELCCLTDQSCPDYFWKSILDIKSFREWEEYRSLMMKSKTCNECRALGINYWIFHEPAYQPLGGKN